MYDDFITNLVATSNYELLCDVKIVMGLTYVLPMLEAIQILKKIAWNKKCFIYDFVATMKFIQMDFYILYVDLQWQFSH